MMPVPEEILESLREIANRWQILAVMWHGYFALLALSLVFGVRLSKRLSGVLLALPLLSVSTLAWMSSNPFNGTVFALAGISSAGISIGMGRERVAAAPVWAVIAGAFMFLFGWTYPHFLNTDSFLTYLYAAPTGLIPCPTLSAVIGMGLVLRGLDSPWWEGIMGATGVFYGVFGALRLSVTMDLILLLGSALMLVTGFLNRKGGDFG